MTASQENNNNENEWLQFMEFIKRKYGINSSDYIRNNHYSDRLANESVAKYYSRKYQSYNLNSNLKLNELLSDNTFIGLFDLNNPVPVRKFTDIYTDTDYLMRKLNTTDDKLYIKCNPVNDTGGNGYFEESSESNNAGSNSTNEPVMLPKDFVQTPGFQLLISIIVIFGIYILLQLLFRFAPNLAPVSTPRQLAQKYIINGIKSIGKK
jgi:hypothetical protein